jgi:hypothetical protein
VREALRSIVPEYAPADAAKRPAAATKRKDTGEHAVLG